MRRKIYDKLVQWKQEKDGTTALMIEGNVGGKHCGTDVESGRKRIVLLF